VRRWRGVSTWFREVTPSQSRLHTELAAGQGTNPRAGPTARRSIDELRERPKPMSLVTVSVQARKWPEEFARLASSF
jgi:hypothetical protein